MLIVTLGYLYENNNHVTRGLYRILLFTVLYWNKANHDIMTKIIEIRVYCQLCLIPGTHFRQNQVPKHIF